jgi:hypothetical protein
LRLRKDGNDFSIIFKDKFSVTDVLLDEFFGNFETHVLEFIAVQIEFLDEFGFRKVSEEV